MKSPRHWSIDTINDKLAECFCAINWDYTLHHSRFSYRLEKINDDGSFKTIPVVNKDYIPNIKKPRKPLYCKRKPSAHCFKNNCPHFAYYNGDEVDVNT